MTISKLKRQKSLQNFLPSCSPTERKKVVAERLNFVLSELKKIDHFREFTIAELAFEISEDTADEAEAWFRAELRTHLRTTRKNSATYFSESKLVYSWQTNPL